MAGGHDFRTQIAQRSVPPVPRIWGPGITDDLGLALDARNDLTIDKSACGDFCPVDRSGDKRSLARVFIADAPRTLFFELNGAGPRAYALPPHERRPVRGDPVLPPHGQRPVRGDPGLGYFLALPRTALIGYK